MANPTHVRATLLDFFNDFADSPAEFVIHDDGYRFWTYSYRQISGAACAFAARLEREGIRKGEKVLFWSENRPEWLAAFWGCLLKGVIVVPIDYRASAEVLRNVQNIAKARAVLIGDEVQGDGPGEAAPVWRLAELDLSCSADSGSAVAIGRDDIAEIVFTSGATAAPKGVVITHRNVVADLIPIEREVLKYRRYVRPLFPLRLLNLLPLSHMFGQTLATFFPPMVPASVVFMRGYAPHEIVRQVSSKRIAFVVAVPKMLHVLRQYITREFPELAHLKPHASSPWLIRRGRYRRIHRLFGWKFFGFVVGGAPLEPELEEFWRSLGFMVVQGYGLTETAPIVAFNHPFHPKPGTVGKPLSGIDLRIAPDGEILVRGDMVTPGYVGAPAEASRAFEDGWFHTADVGALDRDGYLVVRGRKSEMIVTPEGLKVFPDDVELVLSQIPGVRDCAVVGRERVHAVLVLDRGVDKDEVIRRANASLEEHQKIRSASIWTAGELPRTESTGKLMRPAIQRWVDAGGLPPPTTPPGAHGDIIAVVGRYAPHRAITPETTLDELGLSSLERVELMVELEEQFNVTLDERAFGKARKLSELAEQLSQPAPQAEPAVTMRWNRGAVACLVRRIVLGALVLPLTRLCARITVSGSATLDTLAGPVIFAANHQSHFDTPVILAALPSRFRYAVAPAMWMEFFDAHFHRERHSRLRSLVNSAAYYLAALLFNGFPLSQQSAGLRETVRHIGDLVSESWSILIFPEGERSRTGEIKRFQPGVAMVGSRLRVTVVPIRLRGVDRVLPRGSAMVHPGPVAVAFGAPIELRGEDYEALSGRVEAAVRAL